MPWPRSPGLGPGPLHVAVVASRRIFDPATVRSRGEPLGLAVHRTSMGYQATPGGLVGRILGSSVDQVRVPDESITLFGLKLDEGQAQLAWLRVHRCEKLKMLLLVRVVVWLGPRTVEPQMLRPSRLR